MQAYRQRNAWPRLQERGRQGAGSGELGGKFRDVQQVCPPPPPTPTHASAGSLPPYVTESKHRSARAWGEEVIAPAPARACREGSKRADKRERSGGRRGGQRAHMRQGA